MYLGTHMYKYAPQPVIFVGLPERWTTVWKSVPVCLPRNGNRTGRREGSVSAGLDGK